MTRAYTVATLQQFEGLGHSEPYYKVLVSTDKRLSSVHLGSLFGIVARIRSICCEHGNVHQEKHGIKLTLFKW